MDEKALKARALACLAQREHSRGELRRKLLAAARTHAHQLCASGASSTEVVTSVDAVLAWLEANRYLSEQRFVESRVRVRSARFGTQRIRQELAQHGLTLPAQTEAGLLSSEFDRACAIWARKFGRVAGNAIEADPHAQAAHQARQARFLAGRGFSGEVIRRVLRVGLTANVSTESQSATDDRGARDTRATLPR